MYLVNFVQDFTNFTEIQFLWTGDSDIHNRTHDDHNCFRSHSNRDSLVSQAGPNFRVARLLKAMVSKFIVSAFFSSRSPITHAQIGFSLVSCPDSSPRTCKGRGLGTRLACACGACIMYCLWFLAAFLFVVSWRFSPLNCPPASKVGKV